MSALVLGELQLKQASQCLLWGLFSLHKTKGIAASYVFFQDKKLQLLSISRNCIAFSAE